MIFDIIWDFLRTYSGPAAVIVVFAVAVISGSWKIYTHAFPKRGPDRLGDLDQFIEILQQTIRQGSTVDAQPDVPPQRRPNPRGQLKDATDSRADAREIPDVGSGADDVPSLLPEGRAEPAEVIFQEVKKRRKFNEDDAPKQVGTAARHFDGRPVSHDALATSRAVVALDPDRAQETFRTDLELDEPLGSQADIASAYRNLAALDVKRGDLDQATETIRKLLQINIGLRDGEAIAATYTDLGNIFALRGNLHGAKEIYRKGQGLYESLGR